MPRFSSAEILEVLGLPGPEPSPGFFEPDELLGSWGRKWGAADEVGQLKTLLMRAPNLRLNPIQATDLDLIAEQYTNFQRVLRGEGVEIVMAPELSESFSRAMYMRDPLITVPGGTVILRLATRRRRGEEQSVTAAAAAAGIPILGTLTGKAIAEGGSFVKLRPDLAAFGTSMRCNKEGYQQIKDFVAVTGMNVIEVPLPGYLIHLDVAIVMLDHDLALINSEYLPYEFIQTLTDLDIETVEVPEDEEWAVNSLVVSPRRMIASSKVLKTADLLNTKHGVEILPVDYGESEKIGGGLHCSTMELVREW